MSSKITGFNKIQAHPDKDEIVEKLLAGVSVRTIAGWLKQKYPNSKRYQISYMSLQNFRKEYLNLEKDTLQDLQKERKKLAEIKRREQQKEVVQATAAYKIGLSSYVQDSLIDYNAEILKMMEDLREGIEQLKDLNVNKGSHLNHQAIASYLEKYKGVIEMHHKMIEQQKKNNADKLEEDYEVLNKKMNILVDAVKEAFNQTNPEGLFIFMQIVKEKMQDEGLTE